MGRIKLAKTLAIFAVIIQAISVFLPYDVKSTGYGNTAKEYESGIELIAPLFAILYFAIILVLHLIKHMVVTKVFILILSILAIFPGGLILFFVATFSFIEHKEISLGFILFGLAALLSFIAAIIKLTVKVERPKGMDADLLDSF